jgi:hypothetical protein
MKHFLFCEQTNKICARKNSILYLDQSLSTNICARLLIPRLSSITNCSSECARWGLREEEISASNMADSKCLPNHSANVDLPKIRLKLPKFSEELPKLPQIVLKSWLIWRYRLICRTIVEIQRFSGYNLYRFGMFGLLGPAVARVLSDKQCYRRSIDRDELTART